MAQIFVSFAGRDDIALMNELQAAFGAAGHMVVSDEGSVTSTPSPEAIRQLIEVADVVLILVSDDVGSSAVVRREYEWAAELRKLIVPLRVKLIPLPDWLKHLTPMPYANAAQVVRNVEALLDIPPAEDAPARAAPRPSVPASPIPPSEPPAPPRSRGGTPPPPPPQMPMPAPGKPATEKQAELDDAGVEPEPTFAQDIEEASVSERAKDFFGGGQWFEGDGEPTLDEAALDEPTLDEAALDEPALNDEILADVIPQGGVSTGAAGPSRKQSKTTPEADTAAGTLVVGNGNGNRLEDVLAKSLEERPEATTVEFAAYYPPEAKAGAEMLFLVYALTDLSQIAVEEDAAKYKDQLGGELPAPVTASHRPKLRLNTPVTVVLYVSWSEEPYRHTQNWNGSWVRYAFSLPVPAKSKGSVTVTASVQVRGVEIARIEDCEIAIVQKVTLNAPLQVPPADNPLAAAKMAARKTTLYQSIFVSYSRKDKPVIDAYRVAQLALGNQVFVDTYSIRVGEDWRAALAEAIDKADVFQLFWSRNSAASDNVRDEWDYALHYRCADDSCASFIRPVYWETPLPDVPEPLSHLNFVYAQLAPTRNWLPWLMLGSVGLFVLLVILIAVLA